MCRFSYFFMVLLNRIVTEGVVWMCTVVSHLHATCEPTYNKLACHADFFLYKFNKRFPRVKTGQTYGGRTDTDIAWMAHSDNRALAASVNQSLLLTHRNGSPSPKIS